MIRDLVGAARALAGLALLRLGAKVAGVPARDTRVSPEPGGDGEPSGQAPSPVTFTPAAAELVYSPPPRRPLPPPPGSLAARRAGR